MDSVSKRTCSRTLDSRFFSMVAMASASFFLPSTLAIKIPTTAPMPPAKEAARIVFVSILRKVLFLRQVEQVPRSVPLQIQKIACPHAYARAEELEIFASAALQSL